MCKIAKSYINFIQYIQIILSGCMTDDDFISCTQHHQNATNQMEHLDKYNGEADSRIISQIEDSKNSS